MKIVNIDSEEIKDPTVKKTVEELTPNKKENANTLEYWDIDLNELPSKGVLYPEGTKLYGRRLKVKEVKKLAQMNESNSDEVIKEVLKSSIKGIDIETLYDDDKTYIILWLRANTYREPGYNISFFCSNCNKLSSYEFSLDQIHIIHIDENKLNFVKVLKNDDEIEKKYLQVKDNDKIKKFLSRYSEMEIDTDLLEDAVKIRSINNENLDLMSKYNYVSDKLDPQNYAQLKSFLKENTFGIGKYIKVKCNKCEGASQTGLVFSEEFFIPEYKL